MDYGGPQSPVLAKNGSKHINNDFEGSVSPVFIAVTEE